MKTQKKQGQSFLESFLTAREKTTPIPAAVQRVHCPTCGGPAERYHLKESSIIRTQCDRCDYLMVTCAKTGRVVEAYAPSFSPSMLAAS